jgi:hypothetical protein
VKALVGLFAVGATAGLVAPEGFPSTGAPEAWSTFGLQVIATGLCAYLAVVLLVLLLARLRLLPAALHRGVDRWTATGLAGTVRRALGVTVLASGVIPLTPLAASAAEAPPPVMAPFDQPPPTAPVTPPPRPTPRPTPPPAPTTVTVQPGDSFWTIAEGLVSLRLHREPTDPEVIGPWLDLIARNRDVLPDPDDADLLLPGTVLDLPA